MSGDPHCGADIVRGALADEGTDYPHTAAAIRAAVEQRARELSGRARIEQEIEARAQELAAQLYRGEMMAAPAAAPAATAPVDTPAPPAAPPPPPDPPPDPPPALAPEVLERQWPSGQKRIYRTPVGYR